MIAHVENPKEMDFQCLKQPLRLSGSVYQVYRIQINTRNSIAFLYADNEHVESELKSSIPFKILRPKPNKVRTGPACRKSQGKEGPNG